MALNIGFVGAGNYAVYHAKILNQMEGVRVRGFCGTQLEKAERVARDFSDAKGYDNLENMLDDIRLDAVYVCVPPNAHGIIEEFLIDRGIPFFVGKPLGKDLEIPAGLMKKIEAKKVLTSVGYFSRYLENTERAKKWVGDSHTGMAIGYYMGEMPDVGWWKKWDCSGGQFVEQTTHIVDFMRYLLGDVAEVYALYAQRTIYEKAAEITVPDVGTVSMKLVSGAIVTISNTCLLPVGHNIGLHIFTDNGVLELSNDMFKEIRRDRTIVYNNRSNPYQSEDKAFIHAVRTGDPSGILSNYADAFKTHQVTMAANQSAATGMPVRLI